MASLGSNLGTMGHILDSYTLSPIGAISKIQQMLFGSRRILTPLTVEMIRPPDENQQAFEDPLYVPVGPITKARSKKIKEALNGLIQDIGLILTRDIPSLAQRKMKV